MIKTIWTTYIAVVFVTVCFVGPVSLADYYHQCIGELCFKIPADEIKAYDNASAWCENNGNYSFAGITDNGTQDILSQVLNSTPQVVSSLYINIRRNLNTERTWPLLNGRNYEGQIIEQDENLYKFYSCIKVVDNKYRIVASRPGDLLQFICSFNVTTCSTLNSTLTYSYKGQCFVKYENESVSWFEARRRCISMGGDLATFNYPDESGKMPTGYGIFDIPFNTTWLQNSSIYWVGIRWKNCKWNSHGDSQMEIVYTNWKSDEPSDISFDCVCLDSNANPRWSWIDCDCIQRRQFLCVKIVPTTTPLTTTAVATTTMTSKTTVIMTSYTNVSNFFESNSNNFTVTPIGKNLQKDLAIGLGAGIGGAAFVLLIVGIIVAVVKIRGKHQKEVRSKSMTNKKSVVQQNSVNVSTPTNSTDVYAVVVPDLINSQDFGKEEQTKSETVYAVTQFTQPKDTAFSIDKNKDCSNSLESKTNTYSKGPNDIYANSMRETLFYPND